MIVKWLTNEHRTIGGNTMQFVQMGPGKGILLNNIIKVKDRFFLMKKLKFIRIFVSY